MSPSSITLFQSVDFLISVTLDLVLELALRTKTESLASRTESLVH